MNERERGERGDGGEEKARGEGQKEEAGGPGAVVFVVLYYWLTGGQPAADCSSLQHTQHGHRSGPDADRCPQRPNTAQAAEC